MKHGETRQRIYISTLQLLDLSGAERSSFAVHFFGGALLPMEGLEADALTSWDAESQGLPLVFVSFPLPLPLLLRGCWRGCLYYSNRFDLSACSG